MIMIKRGNERGHADHGWLNTYHSFSFADYYDPRNMGFRSLRVINEDWVKGGRGFGMHPHRDMEIITYVLEGGLQHNDSMGNGSVITPGEVQRMSAGTGVAHSEYNDSATDPVHLLQIWIFPEQNGLEPSYEQKRFSDDEKRGGLKLIGSRDARDGAVRIQQDVELYATILAPEEKVTHELQPGRHAWVQVVRGDVTLNGQALAAGDGAAISEEDRLEMEARTETEVLLFDLA